MDLLSPLARRSKALIPPSVWRLPWKPYSAVLFDGLTSRHLHGLEFLLNVLNVADAAGELASFAHGVGCAEMFARCGTSRKP